MIAPIFLNRILAVMSLMSKRSNRAIHPRLCNIFYSNDPNSMLFSIPEGSTLSLNKKLTIPLNDTHAAMQLGKVARNVVE